jgi:hypothetical protein
MASFKEAWKRQNEQKSIFFPDQTTNNKQKREKN